jgi:hypothetical protein
VASGARPNRLARFSWVRMVTLFATYLNKATRRRHSSRCVFLFLHFHRLYIARLIVPPRLLQSRACSPCRSHVQRSAKLHPRNTFPELAKTQQWPTTTARTLPSRRSSIPRLRSMRMTSQRADLLLAGQPHRRMKTRTTTMRSV